MRDLIVPDYFFGTNVSIHTYSAKTGSQISMFSLDVASSALTNGTFAGVGDINGDGEPDIIVSGLFPTQVGGNNVLLRAYFARTGTLFWGSAPAPGSNYFLHRLMSTIIPVGDINGDGRTDILVGGDDLGAAPDALGAVFLISGINGSVIRAWQVGTSTNVAGNRIAYLGDVDADGTGDFAVVGYERTSDITAPTAKITVYSLKNSSLVTSVWVQENISWTNETGLNQIGFKAIGDFNNDGVADLAVMADPSSRQSSLQIRSGRNGAMIQEIAGTSVVADRGRTTGTIFFGSSVASADLDGDRFSELLVGVQQAESPREGKGSVNPYITIISCMKFREPIVTSVNAAGVVFGTVDEKPFVTVNGVATTFAELRGLIANDTIFDRNNLGIAIGTNTAGDGSGFILDSSVRIELSTLARIDQFIVGSTDFLIKPAGTYTFPIALKLASNAKAELVKIVRDGTIATTWLLRRNAANTDYELVYLFDGEPGAISANGRSFGINGAGSDPSRFVTERSTLGTFDNYNAYSRPGIDFIAVSRDGLAAVHRSDSAAVAGYFSFMRRPLEELFVDELPQVDGLTVTPISRDDVTADILASITTADGPQAVLFSPTSHFDGPLIWSVTKPTTQDWRHSPDFHTKSETTRRLAIGAFGRIYALHDGSLFSLSHLRLANVGAPEVDPSQILATTPIGESGSVIVGRSDLGEILYYRRENEAAQWKVIAFSPNSVSSWFDFTTVHGAVAWGDGAALATDRGVIQLARKADGTWDAVNIADLFSKDLPTITRGFGLIRDNDGYIYLTGLTDANELIYFHSRSPNPDINTLWTTANLTREVREAFGVADLDLRGDLVTYVTPWNGLNLDGEPVVYWTALGLDGWRFTNLAQSQEDHTPQRLRRE